MGQVLGVCNLAQDVWIRFFGGGRVGDGSTQDIISCFWEITGRRTVKQTIPHYQAMASHQLTIHRILGR